MSLTHPGLFDRKPADYIFMLLVCWGVLLVLAFFLGLVVRFILDFTCYVCNVSPDNTDYRGAAYLFHSVCVVHVKRRSNSQLLVRHEIQGILVFGCVCVDVRLCINFLFIAMQLLLPNAK